MLKTIFVRLVFLIGLMTVALIIYVSSFYGLKNNIIWKFERANFGETHTARPLYNVIYYPLRYFTASGSSFSRDIPEEYFGYLEKESEIDPTEPSHRSVNINSLEDSFIMIGFMGNSKTLKTYDNIEDGSYVKMTFGRGLTKNHDRFINRIIKTEVIELMVDPRIARLEYSDEARDLTLNTYSSLVGAKKECAVTFVNNYKEQVLSHCQQAGYARNIGGGCYHIQGYSLHRAVFAEAIKSCIE